jgi:hypothetical protein
MENVYWASAPNAEIVAKLAEKVRGYYDHLRASGRLALWSKVHRQYYAGHYEGGQLHAAGENKELVRVNVNDFRNLGQHLLVMTTGQRPAFEPRAVNSDHKSQTQTILASGILDYVLLEKGMAAADHEALETSLLLANGFVALDWDARGGTDVAVDVDEEGNERQDEQGRAVMLKSGDLVLRALGPLDVVRDWTKTNSADHQWYIGRRWVNRYDLAARYPEYRDAILAMPTQPDVLRPRALNQASDQIKYESDDVEVWEFLHNRTDALPAGRKVTFLLDPNIPPLFDGPLPFDDLSLYEVAPAEMLGTGHGYSPLYDLLSLQEGENATYTTLASNVAAFGVQNVWTKTGDNLTVSSFGALKHIQSPTKPEGLNLVSSSEHTYKLLDLFQRAMETISGVNSVARGNPEASLKSGAALALVQAQALQFAIGMQIAWVQLVEKVATGVIKMYKRFAHAPQVAVLAGKSNRGFVQEFTSKDLSQINRVTVELGNPLARTIAGRVQMAELLMERNLIKTPEEYIQVLTTGRLEPVLEATQKEMLAIRSENERLAEGQNADTMAAGMPPPVIAVLTDNHPAHIREHAAVIASPDAREVPEVVASVLAHIQEHVDLWTTLPPAIGMALQIPPAPAPMMPPGLPPGPGGPPALPPGPAPEGPKAEPAEVLDPSGAPLPMPNMPSMPKDALTGDRAPAPPMPLPVAA